MKSPFVLALLTITNLSLLVFLVLSRGQMVEAARQPTMIRGTGLEIVDASGKVRAQIKIEPAGPAVRGGQVVNDAKTYPEAVLLRLIRPDGRPSVKLATTEEGSGLTLSGGIDPTYIVLRSDQGSPEITLTNKDGKTQMIKP